MNDDILDPDTLARLRGADPLSDPHSDDGGLDTEAALRVVLATAHHPDRTGPGRAGRPRHARRRRVIALGAAGAVAAGATLAVVNLDSGSGPGPSVSAARAATIVRSVRHAVQGAPGGILEIESTFAKAGSPPLVQHSWQDNGAPNDSVVLTSHGDGSPTVATGGRGSDLQLYDAATNTIDVTHYPTPPGSEPGLSPVAQATAMLHRPGVTVTRGATLDGTPALELVASEPEGVVTMYVDPHTFTPLEERWSPTGSTPDDRAWITRYRIYRTLTGAQAPASLVSLTAQHPTAKVMTLTPTAWNAKDSSLLGS